MDNRTIIECECGTHMVAVQYEKDIESYFFAMFHYGHSKPNWKHRLKVCWQVLTKGDPYADQIVLAPDEAQKLSDFINSTKLPTNGQHTT